MAASPKAKTKLQPTQDRVVILPSEEYEEEKRGSLYIPDTAKEKQVQGEIVAVGPGRVEKGQRVPVELKLGQMVLYGKYSGTEVLVAGEKFIVIKESDVIAVIG